MHACPKCSGPVIAIETATASPIGIDVVVRCGCGVRWSITNLSVEEALGLADASDGETLAARGLFLELAGRPDDAYATYATALAGDDRFDRAFCHERRAAYEVLRGQYAEALRSLEQALAADRRASSARVSAYETAIANVRLFVNEVGQSVSPAVVAVAGHLQTQHWDEALAAARALSPNDLVDAIGFLSRAVDVAPNAVALQELVVQGYVIWASWSTSGGEGIARTAEVDRERARLRQLQR